MKINSFFSWLLLSLVILSVFTQCANIVPPSGGPVDKDAPKLLSILPSDSSVNIKPKKIELTFDKFMELGDWSTVMTISPLIDIQPQVTANLKKVSITIPDTLLLDNTTYTIYLGNTLKDNREGTAYNEFTYTFSTGSFIDSLQLQGHVLNASTLQADTSYIAVLYPSEGFVDSHLYNKKPLYITKVNTDGRFQFKHLPNKPFRLFVFDDRDKDRKYNPLIDGIAYDDKNHLPEVESDTIATMYLFYEELDSANFVLSQDMKKMLDSDVGKMSFRNSNQNISIPKEGYLVQVDTTQVDLGTQDLDKPVKIFYKKNSISQIEKDKIFLSFEKDGVEIQALSDIQIFDSFLVINTNWQEESSYMLRLIKGWAKDTTGQELIPGRYRFKSKKNDDYSELIIKFDSSFINSDHYVYLIHESDTIKAVPVLDSLVTFKMLKPSRTAYEIFVFKDLDKNGQWSSGHFYNKIQPEPVWLHTQSVLLRAGWIHEETFKIRTIKVSPIVTAPPPSPPTDSEEEE